MRPQTFVHIVGQDEGLESLLNMFQSIYVDERRATTFQPFIGQNNALALKSHSVGNRISGPETNVDAAVNQRSLDNVVTRDRPEAEKVFHHSGDVVRIKLALLELGQILGFHKRMRFVAVGHDVALAESASQSGDFGLQFLGLLGVLSGNL